MTTCASCGGCCSWWGSIDAWVCDICHYTWISVDPDDLYAPPDEGASS